MDLTTSSKDLQRQMRKDVERLKAKAEEWYQTKPKLWGYPTGLTKLDHLTGGLPPGELVILAGEPGGGKTSFAMQALEYTSAYTMQETPVVHVLISAEMPRFAVYQRSACRNAGIDAQDLRRGNITEAELRRYQEELETLYHLPLLIVDTPGMTSENVRYVCEMLVEEGLPLGLVAVDYLQQLFDEGTNETVRVNQIIKNLVYIKMATDCSLLALSQYNRETTKSGNVPKMSSLLGSGNIERSADKILALHRVEVATHEQAKGRVPVELHILKNRSGPKGKLLLEFDEAATTFREPSGGDAPARQLAVVR